MCSLSALCKHISPAGEMIFRLYANSTPAAPRQQSSAFLSYKVSTTYPIFSTLLLTSQSGPPAKPASALPPPPPPLSAPYSARSLATCQRTTAPLANTLACGIRPIYHDQGTKNIQASKAKMIFSSVTMIRNTIMSILLAGAGRVQMRVQLG